MAELTPPPNMPAPTKSWRRSVIAAAVLAGIVLALYFARKYIHIDAQALQSWLSQAQGSIWGLPLTVGMFAALSFVAAPQWALMGGSVAVFGPWVGGLYAWIATIVSSSINFYVGRASGKNWLERTERPGVRRLITALRNNGFLVAFGSRFVPLGPFIFVNMASGASGMKYRHFIAGTALGIIPKIAAVAFLGQGVFAALKGEGNALAIGLVGFIVMVALAAIISRTPWARNLLSGLRQEKTPE